MYIEHNDLKKGDMVELTAIQMLSHEPRVAEIYDNTKGITRKIKVQQR